MRRALKLSYMYIKHIYVHTTSCGYFLVFIFPYSLFYLFAFVCASVGYIGRVLGKGGSSIKGTLGASLLLHIYSLWQLMFSFLPFIVYFIGCDII